MFTQVCDYCSYRSLLLIKYFLSLNDELTTVKPAVTSCCNKSPTEFVKTYSCVNMMKMDQMVFKFNCLKRKLLLHRKLFRPSVLTCFAVTTIKSEDNLMCVFFCCCCNKSTYLLYYGKNNDIFVLHLAPLGQLCS